MEYGRLLREEINQGLGDVCDHVVGLKNIVIYLLVNSSHWDKIIQAVQDCKLRAFFAFSYMLI